MCAETLLGVPETILTTVLGGRLIVCIVRAQSMAKDGADEIVCLIKGKQPRRSVEGIPLTVQWLGRCACTSGARMSHNH